MIGFKSKKKKKEKKMEKRNVMRDEKRTGPKICIEEVDGSQEEKRIL